jgi:hypothetical protein
MNTRFSLTQFASVVMLIVLSAMPCLHAQPPKGAPATAPATSFSSAEIPQSTFTMPRTPKEGRDPFFPNSAYPYGLTPTAPKQIVAPTPSLVLNGLSGPPWIATINGTTFASGEERELKIANGTFMVRCVEIKQDSVVIEIAGQRKELRLKQY